MNYFVIRLPLTYINAVEARHFFRISSEDSILIILYQNEQSVDIRQIKKILVEGEWKKIYWLPYNVDACLADSEKGLETNLFLKFWSRQKAIRSFIKDYKDTLKKQEKADRIFIGDATIASMRHIVNSLEPSETVVIDEGSKVYFNYTRYIDGMDENIKNRINKIYLKNCIAEKVFGYRMRELEEISFFSAWDLKPHRKVQVYKNNFTYLGRRLRDLQRTEEVYFLGAPLVDHKRFDTDVYYNYLLRIKNYFSDRPVLYIPHRDETEPHLNRVRQETGFEIARFDLPIEYKICVDGPVPHILAGFLSSALQTCDKIFNGYVEVISFYIENYHFQWQRHEYEEQYNYLKSRQTASFKVISPPEFTA
ncbi:hypothetical protein DGMP_13740 [Desulfomarina profundi]|uniref:Uncharacterized protein n=1 Tax=Desulfomarina profundi TaxID=2772557 RepID=A0A8D5JR40_9BACT|nr:hypothetical protein [Desulfomarina profundi]BCL60681.1 hypothetical protein DGMP_13740 [Desulfomarina profundi]